MVESRSKETMFLNYFGPGPANLYADLKVYPSCFHVRMDGKTI
uniref:Uncharacterized protein n=1 Tax=Tetranychus urticae TaxID=32264 RepID=T1L147_TETUR